MSDNARGILFMVMFTLIIPIGDALMKILVQEFHPSQALSARFVIMIIMIAPAGLMLPRETLIAPPGRSMLLVRGFLMAGASVMYVAALETVPLATLAAIVLLAPLIVTAVSPFVLGERVGWIRYSAILFGFAGAMVVLRPTVEGVGRGELLALGAPICFAAYVILTRRAGGQANQIGQLLWVSIGALMLLSVMAWFYWLPIDQEAFGLLLISSVVFLGIYLLQIAAFSSGETSVIAPFSYLHIGTAAGAGYLFFGTIPDLVAWIGMGMIVISGVIVALRS